MKEIKAIVRPVMLEKVISALKQLPQLPGFTLSMVSGFAHSVEADSPGDLDDPGHLEMAKLEVVVSEAMAEAVVDVILAAAQTGLPGDGKIFVYDVADVVKIRTGGRGETSL